MSLTRPAYRATITNHTRAWTRTVTAGDTPDPDAATQLLDGLTLNWKGRDGKPFGQLDPSDVTFTIAARSIAELLAIDYDDEVVVLIERPTTGTALEVAEVAGPVTTLALTTRGNSAANYATAVLTVTVVDALALLDTPITDNVPTTAEYNVYDLETATARALELGGYPSARDLTSETIGGGPSGESRHRVIADAAPVREAVDVVHNGVRTNNGPTLPALRVAHRWDAGTGYAFQGAGPYRYFTDYWTLVTEPLALFSTARAGRVVSVQRVTTNDLQTAAHVVPACLVEDVADWTKNRRNSLDVNLTMVAPYYSPEGSPPPLDQSVRVNGATAALSPLSQREDIELMTGIDPFDSFDIAALQAALDRQLDARRPSLAWSLPAVVLRTDAMTDAEWDHHCTRLFPRRRPTAGWLGRPLIVVDIAEKANAAGNASCYVLAGATLTLQRGTVRVALDLQGRPLRRAAATAVTINQWKASATLTATRVRQQPGTDPYADPDLTYDDLKLAAL